MARKKRASALDALTRLDEERRVLETRGADLRRAAALELGLVVLDAGGAALGTARLKELVNKAAAEHRSATKSGTPALAISANSASKPAAGEGGNG